MELYLDKKSEANDTFLRQKPYKATIKGCEHCESNVSREHYCIACGDQIENKIECKKREGHCEYCWNHLPY